MIPIYSTTLSQNPLWYLRFTLGIPRGYCHTLSFPNSTDYITDFLPVILFHQINKYEEHMFFLFAIILHLICQVIVLVNIILFGIHGNFLRRMQSVNGLTVRVTVYVFLYSYTPVESFLFWGYFTAFCSPIDQIQIPTLCGKRKWSSQVEANAVDSSYWNKIRGTPDFELYLCYLP